MTIRKFYTFRVNDSTPDDHTGRLGEITYRDGFLYYHDGSTPGGEIIGGGGSGGGPTSWSSITSKPSFATVATSGSYADLTNKPNLFSGDYNDLTNKPSLFSGAYADLTGKPTIPSLDGYATEAWVNEQGFGSGTITGNYNDLTNKPVISDTTDLMGGDFFIAKDETTLVLGQWAAQTLAFSDQGIVLGGTGGVRITGAAGSGVELGGGSTGGITFSSATTGINYNDLNNKPTIPSLDGYATESWVNSQNFGSGSGASTGNFTFANNTITTDNGQDDIVLSIQGYDATQPTPNLVDFSWTFDSRGGLTLPSNLFFAHAYFTAEDGEQIFAGNTNKDFRLRTVNNSVPGINDWQFGTDGTLTVPGTITQSERLTLNSIGAESGYVAAVLADGNLGRVFLRTLGGEGATLQTWEFNKEGKLILPAGGDIVDIAGQSVLGGSGGNPFDQNLNTTDNVTFSSVTASGMEDADGQRITNTYYNGTLLVGSNLTQTPVSILIGGAGPRNEWAFTPDGNLTLPAGGDIKDSDGNSVLGGGGGVSLPANASGYLTNDGSGNLAWAAGDGTFSGDYNDLINKPTLPSNEITNTDGSSTYSVSVSTTGIVTMTTARGSLEFGAQPEEGAPQHLHIMRPADQGSSTDLYFGDDYNYVKLPGAYGNGTLGVEIGTNDNDGGNQNVWRFETWGDLTAPGGITADGTIAGNGLRINNQHELTFDQNGSSITEQRPGEGYNFPAVDTVAVTGNGSGGKLNVSYGAGDTAYQVSTNDGGTYTYNLGDQLKVTGDALGGVTPDNDLIVEVTATYFDQYPGALFSVNVISGTPPSYQDGLHVRTNGNEWTFGTDGSIRLPNDGSIEIVDDGVTVKHSNYAQLQSNNSYVWVESHSASVEVDGKQWDFNSDGNMTLPNDVVQNTGGTISVSDGAPTVIYTTTSSNKHTVKLLVQAEGFDGANEEWDTQSCEILAVKSFRNNTVAASVYGLVYTSPNPLVTYNSQFNSATGNIEITAVAAQANGVNVRVHAIEINTAD
jgi:flagellar basal body rod protein FlgF